MFSIAAAKFAPTTLVKLREGVNFWMNRKKLVHYTKGHEFSVISSHISHKYDECHAAFEEDGDIIHPEFFYELADCDGNTLTAYEDLLKRVKLESKLPPDSDEPDDSDEPAGVESKAQMSRAKQTSAKPAGFKPRLIRGKSE